ncbi:MAG: Fic family protein [Flavobacteriales bacterium]|nr:Fic family protein [Flavobacteriales bacterium]
MKTFGTIVKQARKNQGKTLADVFFDLKIDAAILSKIERGERAATKKQVFDFISYFNLEEREAFSIWLSDKILKEYKNESYVLDAFRVAEERVKYNAKPVSYSSSVHELLAEADKLKEKWLALKPLNKLQLLKMHEFFSVNYTYDSNKIEGSTLTMQETHLVVNEGLTISGKSMREHLEAVNHYDAIDFIEGLVKNKEPITERVLNEIHYLILNGIDRRNAGKYRTVPVFISGSSHKPPQPYLLATQMEEVFDFYGASKSKAHPIILAADMHEKVVTIHPYIDGNGRTSRLLMNLVLLNNDYTIANIKGDNISRLSYYKALEEVQTKDSSDAFYKLVIQSTIDSLKAHIEMC